MRIQANKRKNKISRIGKEGRKTNKEAIRKTNEHLLSLELRDMQEQIRNKNVSG